MTMDIVHFLEDEAEAFPDLVREQAEQLIDRELWDLALGS
jgi:hypothetical protein